jgi:O-antigen/teichoic acid export membrane protein
VFPAIAALWAVPHYTQLLGAAGFGFVAIVWAVVGWLSVVDLGLSRAVTHGVAKALATRDVDTAAAVTWSACIVLVPLSLTVGLGLWLAAPYVVTGMSLDGVAPSDALAAVRWVSLAVPLTVLVTALRGVIEGAQSFRELGLIRAPIGVAFALFPLWFAREVGTVAVVVSGIVLVRAVAVVLHAVVAVWVLPTLRRPRLLDAARFRALLVFGGWTTVVNTVGPLLNALDRLALGSLAPLAVSAAYGIAAEAGIRIWHVTSIVLPVQYAAFARELAVSRENAVVLYARGARFLALIGAPILAVLALVSTPLLTWWVGADLAADAAPLLRIMTVGLMANLVAQVAQIFVQAAEQPRYTAYGLLWQAPLTAAALWWLVPSLGAVGAALVWSTRFGVDAVWALAMTERAVPESRAVRMTVVWWTVGPTLLVALAGVIAAVSARAG